MRLFVAVFPPAEAIAHLATAVSTLDTKARQRWHLTLAFLGEVPDPAPAMAALDETQLFGLGELAIAGGGRFGSLLWAGVEGDTKGLTRLTRSVRRSMRAKRVPPDDKKFHPHVTIARRLSPHDFDIALPALRGYRGPSWPVTEIVLVRSELGPQPSYHHLRARQLELRRANESA